MKQTEIDPASGDVAALPESKLNALRDYSNKNRELVPRPSHEWSWRATMLADNGHENASLVYRCGMRWLYDKLIVAQLVQKIPHFFVTWTFIVMLTRACHPAPSLFAPSNSIY
jgi:hypothetical protein